MNLCKRFLPAILFALGVIQSGCQNNIEFPRTPPQISAISPTTMKNQTNSHLVIYVVDTLGYKPSTIPTDTQKSWESLLAQKPDAIVYTITTNKIEGYSWKEQILVLNANTSIQFKQAVTERFQIQLGITRTTSLESLLDFRSFVVFVENDLIYSGLFMEPYSALAYQSPVGYAKEQEGLVALVLRPLHSIDGDYSKAPEDWNGVKNERIRRALELAGKLK